MFYIRAMPRHLTLYIQNSANCLELKMGILLIQHRKNMYTNSNFLVCSCAEVDSVLCGASVTAGKSRPMWVRPDLYLNLVGCDAFKTQAGHFTV